MNGQLSKASFSIAKVVLAEASNLKQEFSEHEILDQDYHENIEWDCLVVRRKLTISLKIKWIPQKKVNEAVARVIVNRTNSFLKDPQNTEGMVKTIIATPAALQAILNLLVKSCLT